MRDVNPRGRERFDVSLDGRQIASVVVGAIVVISVVFVLGFSVGKQMARAELRPPPGGDALSALDQPPVVPAPAVKDESLTYHDRLVRERPAAALAEPTRAPAPSPSAPPSPPSPPSAPSSAPSSAPEVAAEAAPAAPAPPPAPASESASADPAAASATRSERPAPVGGWCVQVGAANDRAESDRIAARFERFNPRIVTAVVQGRTWYRVRVGAFETKAAAEKYLKDLSRETGAKGFVTSNP